MTVPFELKCQEEHPYVGKQLSEGFVNMSFCRIDACLIVEIKDKDLVSEAMHGFIDSLVINRIAIFGSDVSCVIVEQADNVEQVRREIEQA